MAWYNFNAITYVELHDKSNPEAVNYKIENFIQEKDESSNAIPFLFKYTDQYLYGNFENGKSIGGRIKYVRLFSLIAIFIIIIACVNFMNLSTVKASLRLKEIGLKKSLGVKRIHLITQFLTESVLLSLISLLIAIAVVIISLPLFNDLTGKLLSFQLTQELLIILFGIMLFTGLLAGSYPALYLSKFEAIKILRGNFSFGSRGAFIRKSLVIFQFTISIILIVGVIIITNQLDFLQKRNLGYDRENVLIIPLEGEALSKLSTYIKEIERVKGVSSASASSHDFVSGLSFTTGISWQGKNPEDVVRFERARVYNNLTKTMGIKLVEGRDFNVGEAENDKIIFNETAIKTMGLSDPIGQKVIMWGKEKEIIGVVRDFHFQSLHHQMAPMFIHYGEEDLYMTLVKIESDDIQNTLAELEKVYTEFNPGGAFDFSFLDDDYQRLYDSEKRIASLGKLFALLAILISCLGLFGLAAFTAERRQKEIGIRKILGAGPFKIITLLSGDFTKMVVMAIIIAIPIGYYIAQNWLLNFAYHIELDFWFFVIASLSALFIAWLTVSLQTVKVACRNPVESLKSE